MGEPETIYLVVTYYRMDACKPNPVRAFRSETAALGLAAILTAHSDDKAVEVLPVELVDA